MALPRVHRLKHRQDFSVVYQRGIRRTSRHLTLRGLYSGLSQPVGRDHHSQLMPTRIGISVSQKVSKRAVVRNRIKRSIRAALRHLLPRIPSGWRIVIVVHPQAIECDYLQFLQELEQLLVDAEVCNGC